MYLNAPCGRAPSSARAVAPPACMDCPANLMSGRWVRSLLKKNAHFGTVPSLRTQRKGFKGAVRWSQLSRYFLKRDTAVGSAMTIRFPLKNLSALWDCKVKENSVVDTETEDVDSTFEVASRSDVRCCQLA